MKKTAKSTKRTTSKRTRSNAGSVARRSNGRSTSGSRSTKTNRSPLGYLTQNVDDEGALNELFKDMLKDIYWAEKYLVKSLPDVEDAATTEELKNVVNDHWTETKAQVKKLEQVFESIGEEPESKKCHAMKGLVEEANEIISETDAETLTRDAALIIAAQKVEHYEIASYGGLASLAKVLGHTEAARLLNEILEEEKEADIKLTRVAEKQNINAEAAREA